MKNDYSDRYVNRELSWLQFNGRVLQEAGDENVPLLERLKFLGIFSNNLDEFFKVRYATVRRIVMAGKRGRKYLGGIAAAELLKRITKTVIEQQADSLKILQDIQRRLGEENIHLINEEQLDESQIDFVREYFNDEVHAAITTVVVDEQSTELDIQDAAAYLAVRMEMNSAEKLVQHAIIEIPKSVSRFVVLPERDGKQYVIHVDDIIRNRLHYIFHLFDYSTIQAHMIKITRDAELEVDNDMKRSFTEKISRGIQGRIHGHAVRFVYDKSIHEQTLNLLLDKLEIEDRDSLIPGGRYHNRRDYMGFPSLGRKDLMYEKIEKIDIPELDDSRSIIKKIAEKDYLQYTPYHSFSYTTKFLREAALDPAVTEVYVTLYRVAKNSQVVAALANAARNGKRVVVEIELKARFDEKNNIESAELLQRAGAEVIFGVPGLKVHCKVGLVLRKEAGGIRRYGFISTGNLNEATANVYTDYTLFTAHPGILKEVQRVFRFFEVNYRVDNYKHLIVSPHYTRDALMMLIDNEIQSAREGYEGYMRLKMNSLSDFELIDKLYEANIAGVRIELIVRGICSLIPGVPEMSENIKVISVVDRYLEHPRVYMFNNRGDQKVYISSADFMPRNMDKRVEVACPIYDPEIKQAILQTMDLCWNDNVKARIIDAHQSNRYVSNDKPPLRSQMAQYEYLEQFHKA